MGCLVRSLIMLVLPLAFFWVPVPGLVGFVAGALCGYLSGGPLRAVTNAVLPFLVLTGLIVALGYYLGVPLLGAAVGSVALILLVVDSLTVLAGAFVGGLIRGVADERSSH